MKTFTHMSQCIVEHYSYLAFVNFLSTFKFQVQSFGCLVYKIQSTMLVIVGQVSSNQSIHMVTISPSYYIGTKKFNVLDVHVEN